MNLKMDLQIGIKNALSLSELVGTLREFKREGGSQSEALEVLEALRNESTEEKSEDVLLELMDFVTGFCSPHMRLWN
jgi:hypothetical protein